MVGEPEAVTTAKSMLPSRTIRARSASPPSTNSTVTRGKVARNEASSLGSHVGGHRRVAAHPDLAGLHPHVLLEHPDRLVGPEEDGLRQGQEDLATGGELDLAVLPVEQPGAELSLEPLHLVG